MWSKTKQTLESRLPESLKNRVKYQYDVYRNGNTEAQVLSILVDGKVWFCTNPKFWNELWKNGHCTCPRRAEDVIKELGYVDNTSGQAMKLVHLVLNVLPVDEMVEHENYFIRLLALLDRRVGRRRVEKMAKSIENEPEWFKKWIKLRLDA